MHDPSIRDTAPPLQEPSSSSRGAAAPVDAIYVLCGGQTRAGGCPPWVEARAVAAASEWKRLGAMLPMVLLGGGSPHAPPVMNEWGQVKHEVRRERPANDDPLPAAAGR